jgi:hypothetical protein
MSAVAYRPLPIRGVGRGTVFVVTDGKAILDAIDVFDIYLGT